MVYDLFTKGEVSSEPNVWGTRPHLFYIGEEIFPNSKAVANAALLPLLVASVPQP